MSGTIETIPALLKVAGTSHSVMLTSFRRNGQGVGSPVGVLAHAGKFYMMTPAESWKARRIAKNQHITLALCTYAGKILSSPVEAHARRLSGEEARRGLRLLRVGFMGWMWTTIFSIRYPGDKTAVYEIELVDVVAKVS